MNNDSSKTVQHAQDFGDEANPPERTRKLQLFRAGSSQFAVFETEISTIAEWREPTPLPQAPESVLGVVSIQGRMLTVLDLAILAGTETVSGDGSYHYLIALRGDEQLALAVSDLNEIIDFPNSDSQGVTDNGEKFVLEVLRRAGAETRIVDVTELFPTALRGRERRRRRF